MNPLDIWNSYQETERAYVDYIFPTEEKWRTDVVIPEIHVIYFSFCDRGIDCWRAFNLFLKRSFPHLKALILQQSWTADPHEKEVEEIKEFMEDPWLQFIWIDQSCGSYGRWREIRLGYTRVLHTMQTCQEHCSDVHPCYNNDELCCCDGEFFSGISKENAIFIRAHDILKSDAD